MTLYFVDYDLRGQRDYATLYEALEKLGAIRFLESSWCFKLETGTAEKVRNVLQDYIDATDGLMVSAVTDWASNNTLSTPNKLP